MLCETSCWSKKDFYHCMGSVVELPSWSIDSRMGHNTSRTKVLFSSLIVLESCFCIVFIVSVAYLRLYNTHLI